MPDTTYLDFVKDPDQPARRAELAAFFGPRPDKFMRVYDGMVAVANRPAGERPQVKFLDSFCWPAFFLGPIWLFYRKMWAYAAIVLVLFVIFSFVPLPHGAGIGLGVAMALAGARLYVTHAISTIAKLRGNPAKLAAASGVSATAGWLSGLVYLLLAGYFSYRIAAHDPTFHSPTPPPSLTR